MKNKLLNLLETETIMSNQSSIVVMDFIIQNNRTVKDIERELRIAPLVYEQRLAALENLLKRGIQYGLQRGMVIEQNRSNVIRNAKGKMLEKYVDELMMNINIRNARYLNQPKIKYSKRKYRLRKKNGGEQLKLKLEY